MERPFYHSFVDLFEHFLIYKIAKKPMRLLLSLALAFGVAILVTGNGSHLWLEILEYFHAESFGITDPQFNLDVGFYAFKLPVFGLFLDCLICYYSLICFLAYPCIFYW